MKAEADEVPRFKPVVLVVMDGWGLRTREFGNAIVQAKTPNYDKWTREVERSIIQTSGEYVGLVHGQMGNSEVGHQNLGAGRVVYQDISLIDREIESGMFERHPELLRVLEKVKQTGKKLHLAGLLSPGGVHSHSRHLYSLLQLAAKHEVDPVLHLVLDGRDVPPKSVLGYLDELDEVIDDLNVGRVATVGGRHFGMDRDRRWDRTRRFWEAMVRRQGPRMATAKGAVEKGYEENLYDELIEPTVIGEGELGVESGDVVVMFNFRSDRMRQLTQALVTGDFEGAREFELIPGIEVVTMTNYMEGLPTTVLYGQEAIGNTLSEWLSKRELQQFHCAETEKYPHVTYFFNGRNEMAWPGEERQVVPSPKVKSYDLEPQMSAYPLTETVLARLREKDDDFVLVNFANPDLVGHTGSLEATIQACEVVDECVGKIVEAVLEKGGAVIVTADHGNAERMIDEITGEPQTSHTVGPVPLFVMARNYEFDLHMYGKLADVAPTILELMQIPEKPEEMTGMSLIKGWKKRVVPGDMTEVRLT